MEPTEPYSVLIHLDNRLTISLLNVVGHDMDGNGTWYRFIHANGRVSQVRISEIVALQEFAPSV